MSNNFYFALDNLFKTRIIPYILTENFFNCKLFTPLAALVYYFLFVLNH